MADTLLVVVSYNNLDITKKCLFGLVTQDTDVDVVLWDNASTDGTQEWVESRPLPLKGAVLSNKNVLWTPAINAGLDRYFDPKEHKYVGWLNNDIILEKKNVVSKLREYLQDEDPRPCEEHQ